MNMNLKKVGLLVIAIIGFFSCDDEKPVVPQFSVDITADSFSAEAGSKIINLTSNVSWNAISGDDWLSVSPSSGIGGAALTISVTGNSTPSVRNGVITLTPEAGNPIKISVSQVTDHQFQVDVKEVSFKVTSEEQIVNLTTKSVWEAVSSEEWLTVSPASGSGNAQLTFAVSDNNGAEMRTAVVSLIPERGNTIEIPVSQQAATFYIDETTDILFADVASGKEVTLITTVPWEVDCDADWVIVTPDNGSGHAQKVNISVSRNATDKERSAIITFIPDVGQSFDVKVTQTNSSYAPDVVKYVANKALGKGNGLTEGDAADFLSTSFWSGVNNELKTKSVEVKFLAGDYARAYTNAPSAGTGLAFDKMGHELNRLIITGGKDVVFTVPEGLAARGTLIRFHGSQNITFRDFNFTGHGELSYVIAIRTPSGFPPSKNISIENCTWKDMLGVKYGATGCHYVGTTNIVYRNCTFERLGSGTGAHMMYHAYGPTHISVIDCHFEDCSGEYVRFRDKIDYAMVKNCTFNRNSGWIGAAYISVPNYNDQDPGDEYFRTNYSFNGNVFLNSRYGVQFRHTGFSPSDFNYLLTAEEGKILESGTKAERTKLLKDNYGLELDKIRIANNVYKGIYDKNISFNVGVMYGAISKGWVGTADITSIFDNSQPPLSWEID